MDSTDKLQLPTPFLDELEKIQPLQADLKAALINSFTITCTQKDTVILSESEIDKYALVVLQGLVRSFHYVGDTEVTSSLMKPYYIIISIESFHTQTPAFESLEALQPSILACMHYQKLNSLYHQFPHLNYTGRRLTEQYLFLM